MPYDAANPQIGGMGPNIYASPQIGGPAGFGGFTPQMGGPRAGSALGDGGGGGLNIPQLFAGGGPAGFGGYNAGMANQPGGQQPPWMSQMIGPNQALGMLPGQMGYLSNIAGGQGAGSPIDQMPAWQSMVQAQQRNINQGANQLAEQFNNGGGLFSTAYGGAASDYQTQARLGQNAMLTQASTQAMQQANQNQFGAAQQLSGQGYGALGQLANQGYGASMLSAQMGGQAAMNQANNSANATMNMWNGQNQAAMQGLGYGMQAGLGMGNLYNQNQGMGMQLGQQQYNTQQNPLTAAYNQWLYNQPQNNPYISMMYSGATGYPQLINPTQTQGSLGGILAGAGAAAMGAAALGA